MDTETVTVTKMESFEQLLAESTRIHGHICAGQVIGVRMAMTADLSSTGERQVMEVRARTVVLSAGALGSTEILQRSRALKLSPLLGQRFSTNGDVLALGWGMGARVNGMARADEAEQPPAEHHGDTEHADDDEGQSMLVHDHSPADVASAPSVASVVSVPVVGDVVAACSNCS